MIMEEIYWLTRLDGINILLTIILIICIVTSIVAGCAHIIICDDSFIDDYWKKLWIKLFKHCFLLTIIVSLVYVLTPTTKEAFAIWGVGGTIDYIQSNEKIKELPDKVVNALDLWVDDYLQTDSIK